MIDQPQPAPALHVETVAIDDPGPLVSVLDLEHPLLWRRRGFGISGHGVAVRLEFSGETRMTDAAAAWRSFVAAATITDPLALPGTGLVAFGSFSFSPRSSRSSVLIVPSMIVGRAEGRFWLTRIGVGGLPPATVPQVAPVRGAPRASFAAGSLTADDYRHAVAAAVTAIGEGRVSKAVLARDLQARLGAGADIRPAIAALADSYPDCWTFAIDGFFGSSPETLVSVHDGLATARVLAGSAARGVDETSDLEAATGLATSSKDQDEHEFAVQSVLASLRPHSRGVVASDVPFTLKLPNVWHLASDVEGVLDDGSTSLDLIQAMHPTAAVAGTPTASAMELIDELEPFDRGRYAGPVGWVGADGDGEWAIALRSAQLDPDGGLTAWAGAGIVAGSDPERELLETRMKFKPIVDAFDPVE
ncbi:chorismate-binding protein [Salinibacterium sp. SYSU T00001]|uniref:isochorismate synthase n=1 Tax=Homoserinimonas sedimenticola TaxID=2986805 RepID=UPI002235D950|nr:chorismate-binding protein [Salinibacterium sedimenticola]MCW4385968.1 chorismate-binding protein [Salinibacterium sedimenticola]